MCVVLAFSASSLLFTQIQLQAFAATITTRASTSSSTPTCRPRYSLVILPPSDLDGNLGCHLVTVPLSSSHDHPRSIVAHRHHPRPLSTPDHIFRRNGRSCFYTGDVTGSIFIATKITIDASNVATLNAEVDVTINIGFDVTRTTSVGCDQICRFMVAECSSLSRVSSFGDFSSFCGSS